MLLRENKKQSKFPIYSYVCDNFDVLLYNLDSMQFKFIIIRFCLTLNGFREEELAKIHCWTMQGQA
jgi:hypothetical protein